MNSLISIVIPCFNDAQFVEQSIKSALNQTYSYKEIIVVDDGSNQETKEILRRIEPQITKLITQENQGQSSARNTGISISKGDYILVLDSDDFINMTFCEKTIVQLIENQEVKIVSSYAKLIFENGDFGMHKPNGGDISNFMYKNGALGTSMFKKKDWEKCGGYDEKMRHGFEDWEFFIRILKEGGYAKTVKEPLYNYRIRLNSTSSVANSNKYKLLEYIFIKHKDIYVQDYENLIKMILEISVNLEIQKQNIYKKREYQLGKFLLQPIRMLKSIIKK